MFEYELFIKKHLGKKIHSITYVEYKKEVIETKRRGKTPLRKIKHLLLLKCDCAFEWWVNVFSLLTYKSSKRMCDSCLLFENKNEKDLVARLKNQTLEDKDLSNSEFIGRYYDK